MLLLRPLLKDTKGRTKLAFGIYYVSRKDTRLGETFQI